MLMNLINKKEGRYLSWEEYKKRLIEIQVINLIEQFVKQDYNFSFNDIENIHLARLDNKLGGNKKWREYIQINIEKS